MIVYNNGVYCPLMQAAVSVQDRGYQFGDGVYEVIHYTDHHGVDEDWHLDRLDYSLSQLQIPWPMSPKALKQCIRQVRLKNNLSIVNIYISITRGVPVTRDFAFPKQFCPPVLTIIPYRHKPVSEGLRTKGMAVITAPDLRWGRCDIKAIALLAPSMAKQSATEAGADDVWMVDDQGFITEGSSCNAFMVTQAGEILTRPPSHAILKGITRTRLMTLAKEAGFTVTERPFTLSELKEAAEAFITRTTGFVIPVTRVDQNSVGAGRPGPVTQNLLSLYETFVQEQKHGRFTDTTRFAV
jgi:D-alanine transaminase